VYYFIINILVLHTCTHTQMYMYIILLQYNCITGIHIHVHVDCFITNIIVLLLAYT